MKQNKDVASTPYPKPPPWYKLYGGGGGEEAALASAPAPPPPPPPPIAGAFTAFGQTFDPDEPLVPPLAGHQLYASSTSGVGTPTAVEATAGLTSLHKELMTLYLELLRVLTEDPSGHARLITSINQVLVNMQHLVNTMRPAQARATLAHALQLQVTQHISCQLQYSVCNRLT